MRRTIIIILTMILIFSYLTSLALADKPKAAQAVESIGEINTRDNNTGTVLAGFEADLILTVIVDMSQAEPGEEIKSLRITVPSGFTAQDGAVTSVGVGEPMLLFRVAIEAQGDLNDGIISEGLQQELEDNRLSLSDAAAVSVEETGAEWLITDGDERYIVKRQKDKLNVYGNNVPNFDLVVDRNLIIVVLPTLITLSTVVTIEFTVDAPPTPLPDRIFLVSLLNILNSSIIMAVQSGNADGRVNNDNFFIETVPATKPDPPTDVDAQPISGENDIVISWAKSDDPLVRGYFIFRSDKGDEPVADITSREKIDHIDRNLNPGEKYSYTVRSYKRQALRSDASKEASAVAPADTQIPEPPAVQPEVTVSEDGIEITWEASTSPDVEKYIVYREASPDPREPVAAMDPGAVSYLDEDPPTSGSFLYAVVAVDDVGNESTPSITQLRQVLSGVEPQPNPFTPLSADSRFNQVTFPAAMVEGGEGAFAVKVLDLEGDVVFEEETAEGSKEIKWDGKDLNGEYVDAGIYVYQATMGNMYKIGSIVVAK